VLGAAAAAQGDWLGAEAHYAVALADARESGCPALEVAVGEELRRKVLAPAGKSQVDAEAAMDAACGRLGRTRDDVAALLLPAP
jgi:hypothetical protein